MSARSSSSLMLCRGRAHDEAALPVLALADDDALQPLALFFRRDLARNAGVVHRRHVHQEPARQRDVTGDARALFADRFLGNLDQDFLAFFEQVGDQRNGGVLAAAEAASTTAAALPPRGHADDRMIGPGRCVRCVYPAVPAGPEPRREHRRRRCRGLRPPARLRLRPALLRVPVLRCLLRPRAADSGAFSAESASRRIGSPSHD